METIVSYYETDSCNVLLEGEILDIDCLDSLVIFKG